MIGSISGSNSYNLYSIGNVRSYASNLVKSYMGNNNISGLLGSSSSIYNYYNSYQSTTNNALLSNTQFSSKNISNLNMLKSASSALNSASRALGSGAASLVSSDNKVVSSKATYYSGRDMSFDVTVSSLATQQQSKSAALSSSADSVFSMGSNSFTLQTEEGSFNVDFSINSTDTNQDALNTIAKAVNSSKAGVTASVETKDSKSSLVLTSDETGEQSAFTVEAAAGFDTAEKLGMTVATEAADAQYSVNGKDYTSASNTVSIPDGRGATMTFEGEGSAKLTSGVDASKVVAAAQNFATAYNATISHLMSGSANGAGVQKALNLISDNRMTAGSIASYGGYAGARLSAMGISIDQDGMMQVDTEKLTQAVQKSPGTVQSALSGYGSLTDTTSNNADRAMRIPSATYTDFSKMQVQNSLINMLMPQTGFLFDFGL